MWRVGYKTLRGIDMDEEKKITVVKPCRKLGWCPYGSLVELFPLKEDSDISCSIFGHDCPVYYVAEGFVDEKPLQKE